MNILTHSQGYWTGSIGVWQWDTHIKGNNYGTYYVVAKNMELAKMQNVKPGNTHIECIVDDFGNLVKIS